MGVQLLRAADGLTNVVTGLGTRADAGHGRAYCPTFMDPQTIANAYSGSGMLRKAVKIPADDMTREWRDWQADADQIEAIEAEENRLGLPAKVRQAEIWRDLGGAAIIVGVPGDPATPVNLNQIGKGGWAFANVVSRVHLGLGERVEDSLDPLFGQPSFFTMSTGTGQVRIHPSRVICFKGDPLPPLVGRGWDDEFWGEARVTGFIEYAMNLDEALSTFRALIKDALNIDIGISQLLEMVATPEGEQRITRRLALMRQGSSIVNANVYDAGGEDGKGGEKIDRHQVTWTGIPEIIRVNAEALCAAADIPMTRLWGRAPEGMNSSGDSQQRDWQKMVNGRQRNMLQPCLNPLDEMLIRSALGSRPKEIWAKFAPLDTPSEAQEAERFDKTMSAFAKVRDMAVMPDRPFNMIVQNTLIENGWAAGGEKALNELSDDERYGLSSEIDPDNPDEDPSDLTQEGGDPDLAGEGGGQPPARRAANDAAPRTLYVRRDVVNVTDLRAWARAQGLPELQDGLHVTIAYSKQPLDWMKIDGEWNQDAKGEITIQPGGVRIVEPLGDRTAVLLFTSSALTWRHESIVRAGASHDYPDYQPHISLTGEPVDLAGVEPYRGKIVLGPEIFEEVRPDGGRPFADGKRSRRRGLKRKGSGRGVWNESDHPRGRGGKFTGKGGSSTSVTSRVKAALANPKGKADIPIGKVGKNAPSHVIGFARVANEQEVRKVINKHGSAATSARYGQAPLRERDIAKIPQIVERGTFRVLGAPGARKPQRVEYKARVGTHEYTYTETVGAAKKRVALLSLYKKRWSRGG